MEANNEEMQIICEHENNLQKKIYSEIFKLIYTDGIAINEFIKVGNIINVVNRFYKTKWLVYKYYRQILSNRIISFKSV